jgi:hypothetical protein
MILRHNLYLLQMFDSVIFFVSEWANLHDEISNKKYVSKYNIVSQIGAMLRSVFLQVIRQRGNVIKILRP